MVYQVGHAQLFATLIKKLGLALLPFQSFSSTKRRDCVKNSLMEAASETKTISIQLQIAKKHVVTIWNSEIIFGQSIYYFPDVM